MDKISFVNDVEASGERIRNRWLEKGKMLVLLCVGILLIFVEKIPFHATVLVSLVHIISLAFSGFCVLKILNLQQPNSYADKLVLSYLTGWSCLPLFIIPVYALGHFGLGIWVTFCGLFLLALWRFRDKAKKGFHEMSSEHRDDIIPFSIYLISLLYVLVSVALPFSHFSNNSIYREFYGDGVQRFGTTYALAQGIPPRNPFFAGAPLQYYWFFLFPYASEYRFIHHNLFDIWKCGQTWTAFFFLPGLWSISQTIFKRKVIAWSSLLFGFFFASYEIIANTSILHAILNQLNSFSGWGGALRGFFKAIISRDPDMIVGIITSYSDQLFVEDFLYVPQNIYAVIIILVALRFMEANRHWTAIFALSSLAGTNTFFILPAFGAFGLVYFKRFSFWMGIVAMLMLCSYALVWFSICNIIGGLSFLSALTVALLATGLFIFFSQKRYKLSQVQKDLTSWLKGGTWAFLTSLILITFLRPWINVMVLILNYGPALVIGIYFLFYLATRKERFSWGEGQFTFLFLIAFCAIYEFITFIIYLQFVDKAPRMIQQLAYRIGLDVNLFNFYHKGGKLVRLSWAIFAGMGLAVFGRKWLSYVRRRWTFSSVVAIGLAATTFTSFVRPLTYLADGVVEEIHAAHYLIQNQEGIKATVLLEDFRQSMINQLVPVSVFYFSPWSGGNPGLTHTVGTWADQYLPKQVRPQSREREAINQLFFGNQMTQSDRKKMLQKYGIAYILTNGKYDFRDIAELVVDQSGGYLYQVKKESK
jgi:hypothetical protein